MQAYLCIIEKSFSGKVLLPLLMENELVGYCAKNLQLYKASVTACPYSLFYAFVYSWYQHKKGTEAKGKGPGSGPGGHRAQETHEQAAKAKKGGKGQGGKGKKKA